MTKVFYFKINEDFKKNFAFYLNKIPSSLWKNILRFRNKDDQYRSLAGRLLIRLALLQEGYDYQALMRIKMNSHGRPFINKKIDFNLTHSGDCVVCCITNNGSLGVDIEKIDQIELELYTSFFKKSEIQEIDNNLQRFYHLWTQKEAISKAIGKGLGVNLKDISIENKKGFYRTECWNVKKVDIEESYICHLKIVQNRKFLKFIIRIYLYNQ